MVSLLQRIPIQTRWLIGLVVILTCALPASATHLAGGTISIACADAPNTYVITVLRYRDCTGATLNPTFNLNMRPVDNSGSPTVTPVFMTRVSIDTVPNNAALNPCQQPENSLCLERHVYKSAPIVIPASTGGYDLYFSASARNGAVVNLVNPGGTALTMWTRIADPGKFPCNNSPTFTSPPPLEVCVNDEFYSDNSMVDPDGGIDLEKLWILNGPYHGTANFTPGGVLNYTPNPGFAGIDTVYYVICDDHFPVGCDTGYVYIAVTPDNYPPFLGTDKIATDPGVPVTIDAFENDSDPDNNWDFSSATIITPPANGTAIIVPPATVEYDPDPGFTGYDTLYYSICDNGTPPLCDTAAIIFQVSSNPAPMAVHDYDSITLELLLNSGVLANDLAFGLGLDADSFLIISGPNHGSAAITGTEINYTPAAGFIGVDSIYYRICEDVYPDNSPPFTGDDDATTEMDSTQLIMVSGNDSDIDGNIDNSSLTVYAQPANGSATVVSPGTIEYAPDPGFVGYDTIYYSLCDLGTPVLCDSAAIVVQVDTVLKLTAANDYVSLFQDDSEVVDVLANDKGNAFDLVIDSLEIISGPANGTAALVGSNIEYFPNPGFVGVDSIIYRICDSDVPSNCETAVVRFYVRPVARCDVGILRIVVYVENYPPLANDDRFYMYDIGPENLQVLGNDIDFDGDLNVGSLSIVSGPSNGSAVIGPAGTITYTPNPGFLGVDQFTYEICESTPPFLCATATVTVTVQDGANIPPIALMDSATVDDGGPISITVINNDHDPDKDSVVYYLCDALSGGTYMPGNIPPLAPANYVSPYSGTNPMPSTPPISIDPETGELTGFPTSLGVYVVKVCVDEYRRGKLIATYNREIEVNVVNCTNETEAEIEPTDTNFPNVIMECVDSTIHFNSLSEGTTFYFWNFGDPTTSDDTASTKSPVWTYPDTGVYTVTLIANPGYWCADTTIAEVRIYPGVSAGFLAFDPACTGQPVAFQDTSEADYGIIDTWLWMFGDGAFSLDQNPSHTYNASGTYNTQLVVTTDKGCKDTIFQPVNVSPSPAVNAGPMKTVCSGDSVLLAGSGNALSYQWKPSDGLACPTCASTMASPSALTMYTLVATGQGGCKDSSTVIVNVTSSPTVDAGPDKYVCGTEATQIDATVNPPFGYFVDWNPTTGLSPPNIINPQAAPGVTTTYTLTITSTSGCVVKDSVTVHVSNLSFDAGTGNTICRGDTIQLNGSLSAPNLAFSWSPANLVDDPNTLTPKVFPDSSQVFTFSVVDTLANCVDEDTVHVHVSNGPPISASNDTTICINSSVGLTVSGGTSYLWESDPTLSCLSCPDPIASPLANTKYFVTSVDAFGCEARDSVVITVAPLPTIGITPDTVICPGDPIQLAAMGGANYQWAPTAGLACDTCATTMAQPSAATTYTVEVKDSNSCENMAQVMIGFRNKPSITISSDQEICLHDTVQLNAGGGDTYTWTPATGLNAVNIPDPLASPPVTTQYTVEVTDAFGCWNRDSVEVEVNVLQPGNFISDTSMCIGESIGLYANGFTTYEWSPASSLSCTNCPDPVATPAATTTYTILAEDALGCSDTGYVEVVVNALPIITVTPDTSMCEGFAMPLQASGGVEYEWSPPMGLSCTDCPSPVATPNASRTYSVTVTDEHGCSDDSSVEISVLSVPSVSAGSDIAICRGDTAQLTASGAASYQWNPAAGLGCTNCSSPGAYPQDTTEYYVVGTASNGCEGRDTIIVGVNPLPDASVSPAAKLICEGDSVRLLASGGSSYLWTPSNGLSCETCPDPYAFPIVSTPYTVRVTNQFGCSEKAVSQVDVTSAASANVTPDTGVCPNGSVQLSATGLPGSSFSWAPPIEIMDPNTATPTVSPSQPREYTVTIVDQNGCVVQVPVFVDIYTPKDPNAGGATSICVGDSAQLSAEQGVMYAWEPPGSLDDHQTQHPWAMPDRTTEYTVTITDENGCENSDVVSIVVNQRPNVDAGLDQTIYEGSQAYIEASGAASYTWSPTTYFIGPNGSRVPVLPEDTITYTVVGTDANGCRSVDSVTIFVIPGSQVYIPTAFSPNGDGKNDVFRLTQFENFNLTSLRIYGRWGNIVFETSNINTEWDGRGAGGEPMPIGAYVFIVEGIDDLGKPVVKTGNVTLLR